MFKVAVLALALVSVVNAAITGIIDRTVPFKLSKYSKYPVTFSTEEGHAYDLSVVIGITTAAEGASLQGTNIGQFVTSYDLLGVGEPENGNFTIWITLTTANVENFSSPGTFTISAVPISYAGAEDGVSGRGAFRENVQLHW